VYGIVAFRYSRVVTVAGKGGRPKKWKSDADRVRAYRARQRGEPEPPKLDQAVEQGDDVARLVARIEELERKVSGDRRVASALRSRVQQLDRENDELRRRLGQRDHELEALRELNARLSTQRDQLMAALNAWAAQGEDPAAVDGAEQLPRAERRRRAREELRRRSGP
jgi:chromosome segregation ATPase